MAELETAADLASNGKIPEAEKIYGHINSEIDTIYKHISAMSGPEILKAITEMGADGFMLGTVFEAGTHLLRNARLSNISMDEYLTNLCQEVGCEVPKNAKDAIAIFDKTESSQLKVYVNQTQKFTNFADGKLIKHFEKHVLKKAEWGKAEIATIEEYLKKAQDLLNSTVKGTIDGFVSKNGFTFRYNKVTNEFATGKPNGLIETFFKPQGGLNYWSEQIAKYK